MALDWIHNGERQREALFYSIGEEKARGGGGVGGKMRSLKTIMEENEDDRDTAGQ